MQWTPLCAGLLTPHVSLTEGFLAPRLAPMPGDFRSAKRRGQETRAEPDAAKSLVEVRRVQSPSIEPQIPENEIPSNKVPLRFLDPPRQEPTKPSSRRRTAVRDASNLAAEQNGPVQYAAFEPR